MHLRAVDRALAAEAILLILADDLTGAADCAAAFVGRAARVVVALDEQVRVNAPVLAIDLDTRSRSERSARRIVRRAFASRRACRAAILFKKIDSTLRGHVAAEIAAARAALGPRRPILLAPAFPAQGRIVKHGRLIVKGVPLPGNLRAELGATGVAVPDCTSDADLDRIARAGLAMCPRPLFIGSAGLAHALARAMPRVRATPARRPARRPVATVVGSASPVSARQAEVLASRLRGEDRLLRLEWKRRPVAADLRVVRAFGRLAAARAGDAHYVLTGGETARAVLGALGVRALRLLGEVERGVPFGMALGRAQLVCTKAGGFGKPETLANCVARLRREMK